MTLPQRHLRVIDEAGEVLPSCPDCQERDMQIAALTTEKRGWQTRYYTLRRDKDAQAHDHDLFPRAHELFKFWQVECNHPRSKFTPERFWILEPHLADPEFGYAMCRKTIEGAAFDPYKTRRKNGSVKRFDDFELIFRDRGKAEEFANRAPR